MPVQEEMRSPVMFGWQRPDVFRGLYDDLDLGGDFYLHIAPLGILTACRFLDLHGERRGPACPDRCPQA